MLEHVRRAVKFVLGENQVARIQRLLDPFRRRQDLRKLQAARESYLAYLHARLGNKPAKLPSTPFPPRELLLKTQAGEARDFDRRFVYGSYEAIYFAAGYITWLKWFGLAERHGFDLSKVAAVFELGCGTAPMLRHLVGVVGTRLVASDVNIEMVEWCRKHVPGPEYHCNDLSPPLLFARDAEFDLVYANSVFTHIPLSMQRAWIEEIARVMKPNGWFLCTVLGERHQDRYLSATQKRKLITEGHIEIKSSDSGATLSTQVGGSRWDVYQTKTEVRRNFGTSFKIMDYIETRPQDLLILRKAAA